MAFNNRSTVSLKITRYPEVRIIFALTYLLINCDLVLCCTGPVLASVLGASDRERKWRGRVPLENVLLRESAGGLDRRAKRHCTTVRPPRDDGLCVFVFAPWTCL